MEDGYNAYSLTSISICRMRYGIESTEIYLEHLPSSFTRPCIRRIHHPLVRLERKLSFFSCPTIR